MFKGILAGLAALAGVFALVLVLSAFGLFQSEVLGTQVRGCSATDLRGDSELCAGQTAVPDSAAL